VSYTSNINSAAINENFPVAGQDNDTQVFRDNFNQIKTNFLEAKLEIEDIGANSSRTDSDNNFNGNLILNANLQNVSFKKLNYGDPIVSGSQEISFVQSMYHIINFGANCNLEFVEFPTEAVDQLGVGKVGKITLELYGDGAAPISAGSFVPGTSYQIVTLGTTTNTQWNTIAGTSSVTYSVGSVFTAAISGGGLGDGTARITRTLTFLAANGTSLKKNASSSWGGDIDEPTIEVASDTNPVIIEVWQHSEDIIFLNYLGEFS
jgi:hypothetical protein